MTTDTTQTLRERAIAAYHAKQAERQAYEARREAEIQKQAARNLKQWLTRLGIEAEPTSGVIVIEGIEFWVVHLNEWDSRGQLYVVAGRCEKCGGALSVQVRDLGDLGEVLENPPTHSPYHECPEPTPAPKKTAAERLAAAIVDVIAEFGIVPQEF